MSKPINIVLDTTMLDTFCSCPEKFNLRFNKNKVTPVKAMPLDRGTIIHTGAEAYYKELSESHNWVKAVDELVAAIKIDGVESDLDSDMVKRCVEVMLEWSSFWRSKDESYEILATEEPFAYLLHEDENIKLTMIGKIDLLFTDYPQYERCPMDHKGYDRSSNTRRFVNQFCNYATATGSNYLIVDKIGFQTSLKPSEKFKRLPMCYDPLILEQWKQDVIKWAYIYLDCVLNNSYPRNMTSCDKYNRDCEYLEVCDASGNEAKIYKLEANFKTAEPWDVASSLGLKKEKA